MSPETIYGVSGYSDKAQILLFGLDYMEELLFYEARTLSSPHAWYLELQATSYELGYSPLPIVMRVYHLVVTAGMPVGQLFVV